MTCDSSRHAGNGQRLHGPSVPALAAAVLSLLLLLPLAPSPAPGADAVRGEMLRDIEQLEQQSTEESRTSEQHIRTLARDILETVEQKKRAAAEEREESSEDLSLPGESGGPAWDIEERRAELRRKVEEWTGEDTSLYVADYELRYAVEDAIIIARHDGKDAKKLADIYEKMQKMILRADFENFDLGPPPDQDSRPSTWLYNVLTFGVYAEEELASYRAKLQKYRMGLYKKAAIAYVRALISMVEEIPECTAATAEATTVVIEGKEFALAGCPDPSVAHLRKYYDAIRKIQSADADVILAEVEYLMAEQQLIADMAAAVPLLGESIDLYQAYAGETVAGYCLSNFERGLMVVFSVVPLVGPDAVKLAMKKSPRFADAVMTMTDYFDDVLLLVTETAQGMSRASLELGQEMTEVFAAKVGTDSQSLKKVAGIFERLSRSDAFKTAADTAREAVAKTLRQAREDAVWIRQLPPELRERAIAESAERMSRNLGALQGTRLERIKLSNMVPEHVEALEQLVREKGDWIVVMRSVNPEATEKLAQHYATKGMNVKGKSADWGAHAGFIPTEQKFSKLGNPKRAGGVDTAGVAKFHKKVRECLAEVPPCAFEAPLKVRHAGEEMPVMIVRDRSGGQEITAIFDEANGRYLDRNGTALAVDPGDARPMMVLSDETGNPLVADYDFMNMGWKGRHESPVYHPDKGYIAAKQEEILDASNEAIARRGGYEGGNISHHGAERWYPGSPGALDAADDVVTVIDPEAGLMIIPRCDSDCMKQWCRTKNQCNPASVCTQVKTTGCFPPDPNRLLKDYYHDRRLQEYTLGPNSVWDNWGNYNPLGGWSFEEYMVELMGGRRAAEAAAASQARRRAAGAVARGTMPTITKSVIQEALPKCTPRPEPAEAPAEGGQ